MPRAGNRLAPILLLVLTVWVFFPVLTHEFVGWDDDINLHDNPYLNPASLQNALRFWKAPFHKLYIPATYSVWSAIAWIGQLAGNRANGMREYAYLFHGANLTVHLLNVLIVFGLLKRLALSSLPAARSDEPDGGSKGLFPAAFCGALVFALHPVQVEPVAWASGMKDLLGGLLALLSLRVYVGHRVLADRGEPGRLYLLALALFLVGLLAKPSVAAVPFIAALIDGFVLRVPARRIVSSLAPWFALLIAWFLLARRLQPSEGIGFVVALVKRPLIAGDALAFYLGKLVWPFHLAPDYGRTPESVLSSDGVYFAWILPLVCALVLVRAGRRGFLKCGAAVFAAGVLPVLGLIPFQHQSISTVADRYLYLSMLGPAMIVVDRLQRPGVRPGARRGWAAALFVVMGLASASQVRNWKNTYTLFEHTLRVNGSSEVAHNNLGHALAQSGRLDAAAAHYEEALRHGPDNGIVHNNLGNLYLLQGRMDLAVAQYEQALFSRNRQDIVDAYNNLGLAARRRGETAAAVAHYRKALELQPDYVNALNNLAIVFAGKGEEDEAMRLYRLALRHKPNFRDAQWNLANLLNERGFKAAADGRRAEALKCFEEALRLRPDHLAALVNLGEARLSSGNLDEAILGWESALRVLPGSAELHHNLAVAWLKKGDRDKAREQLDKALALDPELAESLRLLEQLEDKTKRSEQ